MNKIYNQNSVYHDLILTRKKSWGWHAWLSLCILFLIGTTAFAQTAVIGTGTVSTADDGSDPLDDYYVNMRYQTVYTAAELSTAGLMPYNELTGLGFSVTELPGTLRDYTIKIGHTSQSNAASHILSSLTTVRNAASYTPALTAAGAFDMLTFDANFVWNGVDNIVIDICTSGNPFDEPFGGIRASVLTNGSRSVRDDYDEVCGEETEDTNDNRPNVQFSYVAGTPPSCFAPSALVSSNVTTATATLSWTASTSSPSNGYDIYYSATNTAPLAGTTPTVNNHTLSSITLGELSSATTYYWWVRSDCGVETSTWAFGGSFTTLCDLVTTFSQNWDSVVANTLPVCFNKVGTLGTVYAQAGSSSSGANTLYIYGGSTSSEPTLALQPVSNAGAGTHWLKFKLRANFTVGGKLQVGYLTNPTDETSFVMIQEFIANSVTTYEEFKCIPGTLPGSNTTLALRAKGSPANSMLVDDLVWELAPSCLSPSLFSSSNLTASTATLNWAASNSNPTNGYDIYYNTVNTAPLVDTMPTINNQTGVSANLADLTSATTYFWWIRSDCGAETSSWATGGSFTTLCNAITSFPWTENFESVTTPNLPICWSSDDANDDGGEWITYST